MSSADSDSSPQSSTASHSNPCKEAVLKCPGCRFLWNDASGMDVPDPPVGIIEYS